MNTQDLICEKLLDLMENRPFYQIKVTQLAECCGISRSTFYAHFDSIYEVVQRIEDDFLAHIPNESAVDPTDKSAIVDNLVFLRDNIRKVKILFGPNGDPSFAAKFANRNKRVLNTLASKNRSEATTLELQVVNEFMLGGKMRLLQWWASNEKSVSVNDLNDISDRIITALHEILW